MKNILIYLEYMCSNLRIFVYILIAISILIILFLVIMTIGFGNTHPLGSPVPVT